jgi:hypothetical protein
MRVLKEHTRHLPDRLRFAVTFIAGDLRFREGSLLHGVLPQPFQKADSPPP